MNRPRAICLALCPAVTMPASAATPAPVQAVTPAPTLRYPARPIVTRAQLDAYPCDTPVFSVLRHGELVATVVGWPGPHQRDVLRSSGPSPSSPSTEIR